MHIKIKDRFRNDDQAYRVKVGSGMIPVYRDREKERQAWACVKCGAISDDHPHTSPPDGVCTCPKCIGALSDRYRENYDRIRWNGRPGN